MENGLQSPRDTIFMIMKTRSRLSLHVTTCPTYQIRHRPKPFNQYPCTKAQVYTPSLTVSYAGCRVQHRHSMSKQRLSELVRKRLAKKQATTPPRGKSRTNALSDLARKDAAFAATARSTPNYFQDCCFVPIRAQFRNEIPIISRNQAFIPAPTG